MRRLLILIFLLVGCIPTNTAPDVLPTFVPSPDEVLPLFFWQTETDQLNGDDVTDYWQFGGFAGDNIFIRIVTRSVNVQLTVLQGDTILAQGDNSIEIQLPADDLYRVRIDRVNGIGSYDIGLGYTDRQNPADAIPTPRPQIVGVPTPTPPFSSLGEFITTLTVSRDYAELLTSRSPQHIYTIQGTAGDIINFELYRIAGTFDPVLRFYDADGNLLAMDDNSLGNNNARLLNLYLPTDGLYSVQVDGKGLFGDYTLVFINEPVVIEANALPTIAPTSVAPYETPIVRFAAPDQRLSDHVPALNSITRVGDFQRFSFFAEAGERISMVVEPLAGSDIIPQFEVFDPEGAQLTLASATNSNADGAAVANGLIIAQTGAHIVIVTAEANTIGQFLISFGRGATVRDAYQGVLVSGSQVVAEISEVGTRHIWQLPLNPRDVVSIAVSPNDAIFDPVIQLVNANGDVLYTDDDGGVATAALLQLAEIIEPATYLLRIFDETGTHIGGYTVLWNYVNLAPPATAIPALTNVLVVNDSVREGQYQFYAFQGQAGQKIRIDAIASVDSVLDPVIAVLNPEGDIIAEADDTANSLNPQLTLTLPIDGTYQVRVNGYLSEGQFMLTVAQLFD